MTHPSDPQELERFVVVVFDMCSSSNILEGMTISGNLKVYRNLLISMKKRIASDAKKYEFLPYKFVGDGWILLFPESVGGDELIQFLKGYCRFYSTLFDKRIAPLLETDPGPIGLTFGLTVGELVRMQMMGTEEFMGRALNVAARLQGAVKKGDRHPGYKALASAAAYHMFFANIVDVNAEEKRISLRNILGGRNIRCFKFTLWPRQEGWK